MRKILKPKESIAIKPFSQSYSLLLRLQRQVFQNLDFLQIRKELEVLNSETRLQILLTLSRTESLCVGDLAEVLRLDISPVSHQLRVLKREKLVASQKRGKLVYYKLEKKLPRLIETILSESQS